MRLRHLEVVNAIRMTGTLSGAARLLHITQPAATQILQSAERQLGYQLFRRVRGRLEPSAEALVIFPELENLDRQVVRLQQLTTNLRSREASNLRVLCSPALAQAVMPDILNRLMHENPTARVSIRAEYSSRVISDLALREADIGLVYETELHPVIEFLPLAELPLVAVGQPSFFPSKSPVNLGDLVALPLVAPDPIDPIGRVLAQACDDQGCALPSQLSVQLYQAALAVAATGLGVTIVDVLTALSADRSVVDVLPISPSLSVRVGAVQAATANQSDLCREFIRLCRVALTESLAASTGIRRPASSRSA